MLYATTALSQLPCLCSNSSQQFILIIMLSSVTCCFNPTFHKLTMFITAVQSTILLSQHETICFKPLKLKFHAGETKVSCWRNQSFTLEKPKFHAEETKVSRRRNQSFTPKKPKFHALKPKLSPVETSVYT